MEPVKIGIIGAGNISDSYLKGVRCDRSSSKSKR